MIRGRSIYCAAEYDIVLIGDCHPVGYTGTYTSNAYMTVVGIAAAYDYRPDRQGD